MVTRLYSIQDEITDLLLARENAEKNRLKAKAEAERRREAYLIAEMREDLGDIFDSLQGAEIAYLVTDPDSEGDYAKAHITVTVDEKPYSCFVTYAKNWTEFGLSSDRYGIDSYPRKSDLRNEILLTLIHQIEHARKVAAEAADELPF